MDSSQKQAAYAKFFETHVNTGVTDGILQLVDAAIINDIKNPNSVATLVANYDLPQSAGKAIAENLDLIKRFAKEFGAEKLCFTPDGTWVLPPSIRDEFPEYKEYLLKDSEKVGTGSITLVQNEAIPTFDTEGNMTGGFETGDRHGFLTIVDKRNGKVYELQQTFLENSDEVEMRPNIVAVNYERARKILPAEVVATINADDSNLKAVVDAYIKRSDIELDSTGMLGGFEGNRQTGLVAYGCELVRCPDKAFNWNDNRIGANFNYVPIANVEFELNKAQLDVILFDRELAARECTIRPEAGCTAQQNEEGYVAGKRPSFYPDGTPRYVTSETQMIDGEATVIFKNATADTPNAVAVMEYDTVVKGEDMQVTKPYNHWGASGFKGMQNCFGAAADILEGVAAHGSSKESLLKTIGGKNLRDNGITMTIARLLSNAESVEAKTVNGPVEGEVDIYTTPLPSGRTAKVYDFAKLPELMEQIKENRAAGIQEEPELGGLAGAAIAQTTEQRQKAVAEKVRPPEEELTFFPTGTTGNYVAQCHEKSRTMSDYVKKVMANRGGAVQVG